MKRIYIIILCVIICLLSSCEIVIREKTSYISNNNQSSNVNNDGNKSKKVTNNQNNTNDVISSYRTNIDDIKDTYTYEYLKNLGVSIGKKDNITVNDLDEVNFAEINDTHGELINQSYYMSLDQVGGIIDYLDDRTDSKYIKIMNGDLFQGSYVSRMTYGKCMIDSLNALDFDFMTLGNHEFDWTLDVIKMYWDKDETNGEAEFPLVCCNLLDKNTGKRPDFVKPYHIIEYADVRVGIIGAIGSSLETSIDEDSIQSYYFDALDSYIKKYTVILRNYGCDCVILAVHDYDENYSKYSNYKYEYRLDGMIFGHTHESLEGYYYRKADGYNIPYVQSYTKNGDVGTLKIKLDDNNVPISGSYNHFDLSFYNYSVKEPNLDCKEVVDSYSKIIEEGNEIIMNINISDYNSKEECADLGVRAMMELYDCDMGFVNSGGVRATLKYSSVSVADIFEIYPFDNHVVIAYMKGDKLYQYLSQNSGLYTNSDFDKYNIEDDKVYKICTIDYIAKKYDNYMKYYCVDEEFTITENIMRDKVVEYCRNLK